jgi:hypothetical protein
LMPEQCTDRDAPRTEHGADHATNDFSGPLHRAI